MKAVWKFVTGVTKNKIPQKLEIILEILNVW